MNLVFKNKKAHLSKFTEENVMKFLESNGYLSTAMLQREFGVGYAQAAEMIDTLAEKGYIKYDGQRWLKSIYRRVS